MQFLDLIISEGLVKIHIKIHKVLIHITVRNGSRQKILPISGTLVTVCNPGLLNGDFSSDVFDLLQRSSGMPEIFFKIKYFFSKNQKHKNKLPGLDFELNCDVVEPVEAMLFRT